MEYTGVKRVNISDIPRPPIGSVHAPQSELNTPKQKNSRPRLRRPRFSLYSHAQQIKQEILGNSQVNILGVMFVSGKHMSCDGDYITRKFYAASSSVFSYCHDLDEFLQLQLQRSYCLPILQYATAAICLTISSSYAR
jgi:hypothetical protein